MIGCLLPIFFLFFLPKTAFAITDQSDIDVPDQKVTIEKTSQYRYAARKIWLYQKPDKNSPRLKSVKKSTRMRVTGICDNGWLQIRLTGKNYYVPSSWLSKTNGYTVVIDPGHQQKANLSRELIGPGSKQRKPKVTGGTSGVASKLAEYKLNLIVAKQLKKELVSRGYKVIMTRTSHKVNLSNSKRAKIANKAKADVFLRIHANSANSSGVKGALTICPTKRNPYCKKIYKQSNQLSKAILKNFCKATKAKNRGIMYTDTMSGINWSKVPVTIIEMGFMSNPSEDRKMASASYQKKMVKGMAQGIDSYLKR